AFCPAKLECNIPSFIETNLAESSAECGHLSVRLRLGTRAKKADHRHRALRARRHRPRRRRAAEQRDERAPLHSITSSAALSSLSGTMRPCILAVWWLMISSNLLDCTTGRSAGFVPLRMRPAYTPTCRHASRRLAP